MPTQSRKLQSLREDHVPRGVGSLTPLAARSALGALVVDADGHEWIDFAAGLAVANLGHNHPDVVSAVQRQAETLLHACFHVATYEPYVELARRLGALVPGDGPNKALLLNSGAEAVENAVKIARAHTGRQAIVAFENAFHGRTLLALSLTSLTAPLKRGFGPFAPEVYRLPYAYCYRCPINLEYPACDVQCAELLRELFITHVDAEAVAALMAEPITGQTGFITPPPEWHPRIKAICAEHGILYIADEIQSGMCRSGPLFALEHWDVVPDLVCLAKSLAGGMPLSAVIGPAEIMDAPGPGGLGSTFGGNPVACAAAMAVLDVFEREDIPTRAKGLGERVRVRFQDWQAKHECIGEVRGKGPMLALELVSDRERRTPAPELAKAFVDACHARRLVMLACGHDGNVLRVSMPLTIGESELERGLAIMEEAFHDITQGATT